MKLKLRFLIVYAMLSTVCGTTAQTSEPGSDVVGLPLTGDEAVAFLSSAEVTGQPEAFDPVAITGPLRVNLTDGSRTLRAVFKDENTLYREFRFGDGREVEMARDSYKHEIAAFELDRLLGLGIVPPCVERKLSKRKGSLCLWIEGARPEDERREQGLEPPDPEKFKDDLREVHLFQQLIADLDYSNIRNLIVDADFKVYKIDSSMAFYPDRELLEELHSSRMSRRLLEALEKLDRQAMNDRLKPWLFKTELGDLWTRRERILERADKLVAEHGEDAVLY